jgi:dTDP-4-amino-4,6-dideoxygalactose transaminase
MTRGSHERIYLSPPSIGDSEKVAVAHALDSGWVAPIGPDIDAFESELAIQAGRSHAVALTSGTSAIHLGLLALGVLPTAEVIVPTLTFGATAFAVVHTGARPVFIDVEEKSWNLDPNLLESELKRRARLNRLPAAIIPVDVFGRTCDYDSILRISEEYEIPVLVDSAESMGAMHGDSPAGSMGQAAIFSFNGNKIITTSGGGALVTDDAEIARKVRHWSTQSREPFPWYEHEEIGYNYRMSNILASIGRAQLKRLPDIVERRRQIRDSYATALETTPGVRVMGDPPWGTWNGWLTTVRFDSSMHPHAPTRIREALDTQDIESRPVWKPMHQQPVFASAESAITGVADHIYEEGLCLPSGTSMTNAEVDRVIEEIVKVLNTS